MDHIYLCIDLKSFYASAECVERGLDPMTTDLVVADPTRTDKTICLAVSPSLRAKGVRNRCRVFEIPGHLRYVMARPRMKLYMEYSARIYGIYLSYVAKEDIQVYSIDEAFLDVTHYLSLYGKTPKALATEIMRSILRQTGITATCGIGTNLYLAKIALDITAKHVSGHIGILDQQSYISTLWDHKPLSDFWKIGAGIATRLEHMGIRTMRQVALCDQKRLKEAFGVDAELLFDHAWGRECCTIEDIHSYRSKTHSFSTAQVLSRDYSRPEALLLVKEMADTLSLSLVEKHLVTETVALSLSLGNHSFATIGGSEHLFSRTNSNRLLIEATGRLYERITKDGMSIRRIGIVFSDVVDETNSQSDLFSDPRQEEKDRRLQLASLAIKQRFGKNAILKCMDLEQGATTRERNLQIGGHRSGDE
ncbi:MAG: DNA methylase [Sphaerochaetaceae bacterium]|nr:DNA methylase [Spirochaetales bacterium]MDY5498877.1 DNA methylase [Sphaerochaetaceae bacterium]